MSPHTWWYVARATGYVGWGLMTASVVAGLVVSGRMTTGRPTRAWTLDLHRFLAGAAVAFTSLHVAGLVGDTYVHFGVAELLLPFASAWRPTAVAMGVVTMYLLGAIFVTSLLMRRLPRRLWRMVHLSSYVAFWLGTFHLLTAGTDAVNPVSRLLAALAMTTVVFLTVFRVLERASQRRRRPARTPALMTR